MANTPYPNYVLETKFEDQYNSYLDLMQFCTVDNSLTGEAGMKKRIRTYSASGDKTQVLQIGQGNTVAIEAGYSEKEYEIELLQNRFIWFDEEEMTDPLVIDKGLDHQAVDMYNTANAKAISEFQKASQVVYSQSFDFNAFVDAIASITDLGISESREIEGLGLFALCAKQDVASIRKGLGDYLKYVEAYARRGYIGTVAGVNLYISAIATEGVITIADKKAVTYFNKKGAEVEQEREANVRKNTAYLRKYGIFALTDQNHIVKLAKGGDATLSALTFGSVTISPTFNANTTSYTCTTTASSTTITATATATADSPTVVIKNGSSTVTSGNSTDLAEGLNTITVTVTNGLNVNTYTVLITRVKDSSLASLSIGSNVLTPTFEKGTLNYTTTTSNSSDTVTATATDSGNATVTIKNGDTTVTSGSSASWTAGDNNVVITVTNGTAKTVYNVLVTYED